MRNLTTVAILVFAPISGQAEELGWSYSISAGAEYEPTYVGSDTYVSGGAFNAEANYGVSDQLSLSFSLGGAGATYRLSDDTTLLLSLEYEPGRDNADDEVLSGFKKMEDTWEIQAVAMQDLGPIDVGIGFQQDILGRGKGLVGFAGLRADLFETERFALTAGADFSFADATHMNTEVGISAAEAIASGLDAYEAESGYKGATLVLQTEYQLTASTSLFAEASVETYGSAITDSPLVRDEGANTTRELEIGVSFDF